MNDGIYFLTFTVERWYHLFDRYNRWEILAESLRYCQANKGLVLHGYVFMPNHLHLIAASADMAGFVRDFKRHTSQQFRRDMEAAEPRVLRLFLDEQGAYRFWQEGNAPKWVENPAFYQQKLEYIHNNPVRKGYVDRPEYWKWSSANPQSPLAVVFLECR